MIRIGLRVLLTALSIQFVMPLISGFQFHGGFLQALLLSAAFTVTYFLAGTLLGVVFQAFTGDPENGRKMVPLRLVLFWAICSLVLAGAAWLLPSVLTVAGWLPVLTGGLLLLYIGIGTSQPNSDIASYTIRNIGPNKRTSVAALFAADSTGQSCPTGRCSSRRPKPAATVPPTGAAKPCSCGKNKGNCSCRKSKPS